MFSKIGVLFLFFYKGVFLYIELFIRVLMNLLLVFNVKSFYSFYIWELFFVEICKYYRNLR